MLHPLCDFFLLLSNDGKKITNNDLSIFYKFIIKKIPQIEQQYPSLILESLSKINEDPSFKLYESKKQIYLNELKNNNELKEIIFYFQKQLLILLNDLIYFFYKEGIIKLNNNIENKIKEKFNEIYKPYEIGKKELKEKKIDQIKNLLIFLTIKGFIKYSINSSDFINFFNGHNKFQNRYWVVQFMNYINKIIKIYKKKRIINTEKKANKEKKVFFTDERNNNTDGNKNKKKYIYNDYSKDNSTGKKSNKTDNRTKIQNMKYLNIIDKKIFNTEKKLESQKKKDKKGIPIKDIKLSLKEKEFTINNSNDNDNDKAIDNDKVDNANKNNIQILDESENEVDDTLRCETLKNAFQSTEEDLTESKNISKKFLNNRHDERRSTKIKNKTKTRLTINNIPLFEKKFKSKEKKTKTKINLNSPKPFYHSNTQKNKLRNRNINYSNRRIFENLDFYSFEQSNTENLENHNSKGEKKGNVFDNCINQEIKNRNITNLGNEGKNITNNYININEQNDKKTYDTIFNNEYNLVSKVKLDNNNNLFKESFLYKNLEVFQHSVIFTDVEDKEKKDEDEDDDKIGCIIM